MKKIILLIMMVIVCSCIIFAVDAPIGEITSYTANYSEVFEVIPSGGFSPYGFTNCSDCAILLSSTDSKGTYQATGSGETCYIDFFDLFAQASSINLSVKCACRYCNTATMGAMTCSNGDVEIIEVATDPGGPDLPIPDEERCV